MRHPGGVVGWDATIRVLPSCRKGKHLQKAGYPILARAEALVAFRASVLVLCCLLHRPHPLYPGEERLHTIRQ